MSPFSITMLVKAEAIPIEVMIQYSRLYKIGELESESELYPFH